MTEFRSFPFHTLTLPPDGKVTGTFEVWFRGEGSIGARTDAHINDDKQAVDYRGESWLMHLEFKRAADGTVTNTGLYDKVTRRSNWSDAPPSYAAAIKEAVRAAVEEYATDEMDRDGTDADARQKLHSLERTEADLVAQLSECRKSIRHETKRLANILPAEGCLCLFEDGRVVRTDDLCPLHSKRPGVRIITHQEV